MKTKYDVFTKDKEKISYRAFIQATLIELGLSPTSKGTYYFRDIIIIALQEYSYNDVSLIDLRNKLALREHITPNNIKSNIDYAFKFKDTSKAKANFETIFNIKYDEYYITAKALTNLIINLIYTR
jgi:hypothetical protein